MSIESLKNNSAEEIDILSIYKQLDNDPNINRLLDKVIDEENGPQGISIWPSNLLIQDGKIFKIDGNSFDQEINKAKEMAVVDNNDQEKIAKINKIASKKKEVLDLIAAKLEKLGYSTEIIF